MSNNKVNCILQDSRGFTWIGTDDGLNWYDGQRFVIYRHLPGETSSLGGNIVSGLVEAPGYVFWIATQDGGLTRFDPKAAPALRFRHFRHRPADPSSIPVNIINGLLLDEQGFLWLATSGAGLVRMDTRNNRFLKIEPASQKTCSSVCLGNDGLIWTGRQGGSYQKVNSKTLEIITDQRYTNPYAKRPHVTVTAIYRDSRKDIWFGSWDHAIYRYIEAKDEEQVVEQNDEATAFLEDSKGKMWVGTKASGLLLLDPGTGETWSHPHSAAREGTVVSNKINCLYKDAKKNIWVGTDRGISLYQPGREYFSQEFLPSLPGAYKPIQVNDFIKMSETELWIASSVGIFISQGTYFRHLPITVNGNPVAISKFYKAHDGSFYFGSDYSLFRIDPKSFRYSMLPNTEKDQVMGRIIASRVVSVEEDSIEGHPALLVSPFGHYITYYDLVRQEWVSRGDSIRRIVDSFHIADNLVHKIMKDQAGNLWLATVKNGLGSWQKNKNHFHYFVNDPFDTRSISNNHVNDVEATTKGELWVSTFGGGLNRMDLSTNTFSHIPNSSNLLEGISVDHRGRIWMIGNGDLHRYDTVAKSFESFSLPDLEKSGGIRGDLYSDPSGLLYAGGTNFFIRFHPDSVKREKDLPQVRITDFYVFDSSYADKLDPEKSLRLNHRENYFTINFSAPWYRGKVFYQYMLEGVDPKWVDAEQTNSAPYTNIAGGKYKFKVRATTTPGIWPSAATVLPLEIIPPYWETGWFLALVTLLAGLVIYAAYRYRINELLKRQAIRNRIAQDLHDNMGSTLSSISVYSQVARIYKEQQKDLELSDTLDRISVTSGEMISEMNDIVWAINPRNDNMEKIVQRMESFAKPLMKVAGIRFSFEFDPSLMNLSLDMEKRKNFYLIFKEAVNNAMKYSGAEQVSVKITQLPDKLQLQIIDNGRGFDPAALSDGHQHSLSGNGVHNMKQRAAEMGGDLKIESYAGKGTSIRLQFRIP